MLVLLLPLLARALSWDVPSMYLGTDLHIADHDNSIGGLSSAKFTAGLRCSRSVSYITVVPYEGPGLYSTSYLTLPLLRKDFRAPASGTRGDRFLSVFWAAAKTATPKKGFPGLQ